MYLSLTATQSQVWHFLIEYFDRNDQLPPYKAIAERFGWASHNAAVEMMQALESKGYIERNESGKYRFARVAA